VTPRWSGGCSCGSTASAGDNWARRWRFAQSVRYYLFTTYIWPTSAIRQAGRQADFPSRLPPQLVTSYRLGHRH
jgi:hypothetical protein